MLTCSINSEEKICPEMELLNQACLDLVEQIEELKRENAWLKKLVLVKGGNGSRQSTELPCNPG